MKTESTKKNPWKPVVEIKKRQSKTMLSSPYDEIDDENKFPLGLMKNSALPLKPQTLIYVRNLEEFLETEVKSIKIEPGTNSEDTISNIQIQGEAVKQEKLENLEANT